MNKQNSLKAVILAAGGKSITEDGLPVLLQDLAGKKIIDYVVVHELTHIREKNHSRRFWGLLAETLPGYEQERAWLHDQGHLLDF